VSRAVARGEVADDFRYGMESVEGDLRCLRTVRETDASAHVVWLCDGLDGEAREGDVGSENRRREVSPSEGDGAVEGRPLDLRFFL